MKQLTYEEVSKSIERLINIVQIVDEDYLSELGFEYTNEEFQNDLADARDFIEQHKPSTFDEVVKAWKKVDKDLNVYIHNNEFCVTDIDDEETTIFWYDIKTGGYEFECVSMEMIYAINLTIRYLQAKEKENDDIRVGDKVNIYGKEFYVTYIDEEHFSFPYKLSVYKEDVGLNADDLVCKYGWETSEWDLSDFDGLTKVKSK